MKASQTMNESLPNAQNRLHKPGKASWIWGILLLGIIFLGAWFRFTGLNWDQNQHLHPDERFLTMVETSIVPVQGLGEYFDTARSSLNPANRGHTFFVYGTLPIFVVRYLGEWLGQTGFDEIQLVGRAVSGTLDLLTVLLVYLIALRLYGRQRLALLAAAFSAFSVLPIQISHYFVVDNVTTFFLTLAMYAAVVIATRTPHSVDLASEVGEGEQVAEAVDDEPQHRPAEWQGHWQELGWFIFFGVALGMAVASKVNAAPVAVLLPAAAFLWWNKLPADKREEGVWRMVLYLFIAAAVSLVTFRIFQPYAFQGPGFFGVGLNPDWVETLRRLAAQTSGDVDFPPALQWARRPLWFSGQNMVLWGLGLPLGIAAWAGFVGMGWRMWRRGEWQQHLVLWGWTALYFSWQSLNANPTMRYQLPVYPSLAVIAAWGIFALWDRVKRQETAISSVGWRKVAVLGLGLTVLGATFAWAYAFTRIYTRPVTRVAASEWIYQNVPAAINLRIANEEGVINHPVAFAAGYTASGEEPLVMAFTPQRSAHLTGLDFAHILPLSAAPDLTTFDMTILISGERDGSSPLASGIMNGSFDWGEEQRGAAQEFFFPNSPSLTQGKTYYVILQPEAGVSVDLAGPISMQWDSAEGDFQQALAEPMRALREGESYTVQFTPRASGKVSEVFLPHVVDWEQTTAEKTVRFRFFQPQAMDQVLGQADLVSSLPTQNDPRGKSYTLTFDPPLSLEAQQVYVLQIEFVAGSGTVALYGSTQAKESSWDDPLPVGLYGLSPYDYHTGLFRTEHNFEMYWDDNAEKLQRFLGNLDQADYIFISSNRQWGTTTRVPERYPLTTAYYRNLLGCPEDKDILWCYRVAEPGMFQGKLGFELVKVEQSDPNLGALRFNTQFAEEAFTVYDHPKVLIFEKQADYDAARVREILQAVDLSTVIHVTPRQAGKGPGTLLLPADRLAEQRAGGTWSALFPAQAWVNRWPGLGAVAWYLALSLLGWAVWPLVRLGLGTLPDKGYPFVRLAGLLLLANLTWLAGSAGIAVSRSMISVVLLLLVAINAFLFWKLQINLRDTWHSHRKTILTAEAIFLAFFLIDLLIRLGNPDLWHPYKGGEKPMDFSYFQAVIKSTTFPPYDPWFAGGYINYYYYGFVVAGILVKWLGIEPAIAYNLVLPTLFACVGTGAFSIGWNLFAGKKEAPEPDREEDQDVAAAIGSEKPLSALGVESAVAASPSLLEENSAILPERLPAEQRSVRPVVAGASAALAVLILGNLGTVLMIVRGFQRIAAPAANVEAGHILQRGLWFFQGIGRFLSGTRLPYPPGEWYWIPSRAIPGNVITEFPFFTFLYADLHAHMLALPITLLALAWALSVVQGRWQWQEKGKLPGWVHVGASFFLGALALGALRPTNTWDFPTYVLLGVFAVVYTVLRYHRASDTPQGQYRKAAVLVGSVGLLLLLTWGLYLPFGKWYGAGYTSIMRWTIEEHTPVGSYLVHWGLFLFVITTWLTWETRDWMAKTPVSALNKLRPFMGVIYGGLALLAGVIVLLLALGVSIAWLALPLAAWAAILLLRPGQPDEKRFVLFLVGSGLFLTLFVEVFVLEGDIGRMNTVFKFYLQAWTMLGLSAAAGLMWLVPVVRERWHESVWRAWRVGLGALVLGAALFPLAAGLDKITDRMSVAAPHTLDGMAYMQTSVYSDQGVDMQLGEDYQAIQWMLENVPGSPVIAEANTPEYRWGSRFTINTGLPGVVGWNWHQRQQRSVVSSDWVTTRVEAIHNFYGTSRRSEVEDFLERYDVQYIIVGQLERAFYPGPGLDKFEAWDGDLWQSVYRQGETVIYQTLLETP